MTDVAWPPSGGYIASVRDLGFPFAYPEQYAESIVWQEQDIDAGGEGLLLGFLQINQIAQWLATAKQASSKPLVPFARGDNGDWLCCFDASDSSKVYVINLGETRLRAVEWSSSGYLGFLDEYLPNYDLPRWRPSSRAEP